MTQIVVERITEFQVHCPKDNWNVDPNDDCENCDHFVKFLQSGKTDFVECNYEDSKSHNSEVNPEQ